MANPNFWGSIQFPDHWWPKRGGLPRKKLTTHPWVCWCQFAVWALDGDLMMVAVYASLGALLSSADGNLHLVGNLLIAKNGHLDEETFNNSVVKRHCFPL